MSIEALRSEGNLFTHEARHDLESLFYVILYICTYMCGPGKQRLDHRVPPPSLTIPVLEWSARESRRSASRRKILHMVLFEELVLDKLNAYWDDFKPYLRRLHAYCFFQGVTNPNGLTHRDMLTILHTASSNVREPDEDVEMTQAGKRQRERSPGITRHSKKAKSLG